MNQLISTKLMGGLGNQLFSISHALSQGWKNNRPVVFQPYSYTPLQGNTTNYYINNIFKKLTFSNNFNNFNTVKELSFDFNPVSPLSTNTIFEGYFQSSKHWYGYDDDIQNIFQPDENIKTYLNKKYPEIKNENTVSIHIRRGDYVNSPSIHPIISLDYINKALTLFDSYSNIFIFTDDHNWVNKNFLDKKYILVNEEFDWLELYLMSLCNHNIISNSTFSWWGSFLNKYNNKKIIAPSIWFGPDGPKLNDLYEKYWTIIDVEINNNYNLIPKKYE